VGILDRARAAMMDYTFPGERDINGRHTFDPLTAPIVIPPCLIPSPLPPSIVTPTTTTTITTATTSSTTTAAIAPLPPTPTTTIPTMEHKPIARPDTISLGLLYPDLVPHESPRIHLIGHTTDADAKVVRETAEHDITRNVLHRRSRHSWIDTIWEVYRSLPQVDSSALNNTLAALDALSRKDVQPIHLFFSLCILFFFCWGTLNLNR
jgi:hypothetical protein